jgi:hypothetical protein
MFNQGRVLMLAIGALVFLSTAPGASTAQAEAGASWQIINDDEEIVDAAKLHAEISALLENKDGSFLTTIAGISVRILCASGFLKNSTLLGEGSVSAGTVSFGTCKTYLNGKLSEICIPHSPGKPAGTIETRSFEGLIVLHVLANGVHDELVRLKPVTGTTFVVLEFSEVCAIGEEIPVQGTLFVEESEETLGVFQRIHEFEQGPLTDLWVLSHTAEHAVNLDGRFSSILWGTHLAERWIGEAG